MFQENSSILLMFVGLCQTLIVVLFHINQESRPTENIKPLHCIARAAHFSSFSRSFGHFDPFLSEHLGGFLKWWYPNSWMLYFMENPKITWYDLGVPP